ncbi:hypothetical protein C1645_773842, partial [Glomus cerebriforme]
MENIMTNDIWAIPYENYTLRILPNETQADEYKRRTLYCYKLTGIPISATITNLEPLLTKLQARTCTFTNTHPKRLTKTAFLHVAPEHHNNNNKKLKFESSTLYVLHPQTQSCSVCGSPSHKFNKCNRSEQLAKALDNFPRHQYLTIDDPDKKF